MSVSHTGFQRGDVIFTHNSRAYYLRLTLGALAEICARLNEDQPLALAKIMQSADDTTIGSILCALARPAHGDTSFDGFNAAHALNAIAQIFEKAFEMEGTP